MANEKHDSKEDDLDQQLSLILEIFGRKQEAGESPLSALPPSRRLVPNAPLNKQEWNVIVLADLRFYGIKAVPKDDPIYQRGWSISFVPPSQQGTQKPLKKTLTQLLKEHGIKDAPADDPIYREKYSIGLCVPSKQLTQQQPEPLPTEEQLEPPQTKLIDRNSKEPEDRAKFLHWLGAMSVAFRAPQAIVVARVREVARSAKQDGVDWRDVYGLVKLSQSSRYPQPPSENIVNPER